MSAEPGIGLLALPLAPLPAGRCEPLRLARECERVEPWRRVSRRVAYENPGSRSSTTTWFGRTASRASTASSISGTARSASCRWTRNDSVLLVGQYRYALDHYTWEIPEGGGHFDEEPEEAARRELVEETGYGGGAWRELCRARALQLGHRRDHVPVRATGLEAGPLARGHRAAPVALGAVRRSDGDDRPRRDHRRDDDHGAAGAGPGAGVGWSLSSARPAEPPPARRT